ncbi:TetR family transcriptional regulator [Mycobacterium sp.]|uniref:TetR/AcrR family transcriptional regulator n=1 Tax=Mycobacterium sp. TaxID=1785 RepID=UPI002EE30254
MPPLGRRPGKTDTRNVLLQNARRMFAEGGYNHTSVRDIAAAAGVDPAMIRHYFGSKAQLFRATMGWPFDPGQLAAQITSGDRSEIGARLTQVFFGAWEQPDSRAPLLAILRGAATHEESATLVRQFIQTQLYPQIAAALEDPKAELGVDLAMAQLLGIAYLRHILCVEPIASTPIDELVARVAPVISAHLDLSTGATLNEQ